jgi:hypothetical protein
MTGGMSAAGYAEPLRRNAVWVIVLLALASSASGITNGFAFDDVRVIVNNDRVHSLSNAWQYFGQTYWPPSQGGTLYRPLTILAFSIEWAIGRGSPLPFHIVNIALYAVACVALYRLLKVVVDENTALLASMLFAVHPVHTEAVANVVGQPELVVATLLFLAVHRYIVARRSGKISGGDAVNICGLYFIACLFKEHAIILPGLLVAAETVIGRDGESARDRINKAGPLFVLLVLASVAFVALRTTVTGGFRVAGVNELLGGEPYGVRVLTMLAVVPEWLRLLVWPSSLSADYSFPRTQLVTAPGVGMIPGLAVLAAGALIAWRMRRTLPAVTFAFLWIAVTMAIPSNLIMITGFVLAERTLFLASAAVALLAAVAIVEAWRLSASPEPVVRRAITAAVVLVIVCGVARSATRNPAWRNNETLFRQTVADVPISSRAHWMLAETLAKSGRTEEGAEEIRLAVALGRKDDFILLSYAADQLSNAGQFSRALPLYYRALELTPHNELLRSNAALCLMRLGRIEEAKTLALAGPKRQRRSDRLQHMVTLADSIGRSLR